MSSRVETFILRLFRVIILCVTCFVVPCSRSHLSWVWMRDCVRWNKAGHIQTEDRKGERAHSFTHNTCTQYSSSLPMIYIHAHKLRTAHCACYRTTGTNMFLDICMYTHTRCDWNTLAQDASERDCGLSFAMFLFTFYIRIFLAARIICMGIGCTMSMVTTMPARLTLSLRNLFAVSCLCELLHRRLTFASHFFYSLLESWCKIFHWLISQCVSFLNTC